MARPTPYQQNAANDLAFTAGNYKLLLAGIGIIIVGFLLMSGGGSGDPEEFNPDIFSPRRITVAPIVTLIGYMFVVYAIMKRTDREEPRS
jgi:hypothetical protein